MQCQRSALSADSTGKTYKDHTPQVSHPNASTSLVHQPSPDTPALTADESDDEQQPLSRKRRVRAVQLPEWIEKKRKQDAGEAAPSVVVPDSRPYIHALCPPLQLPTANEPLLDSFVGIRAVKYFEMKNGVLGTARIPGSKKRLLPCVSIFIFRNSSITKPHQTPIVACDYGMLFNANAVAKFLGINDIPSSWLVSQRTGNDARRPTMVHKKGGNWSPMERLDTFISDILPHVHTRYQRRLADIDLWQRVSSAFDFTDFLYTCISCQKKVSTLCHFESHTYECSEVESKEDKVEWEYRLIACVCRKTSDSFSYIIEHVRTCTKYKQLSLTASA